MPTLYVAQLFAELRCGRRAGLRITRHGPLDHRTDITRQARIAQGRDGLLGDPQELRDHLLAAAPLEHRVPRRGAEQRRRQAVDVRGHIRRIAQQHLRRGVGRRTHDRAVGRLEPAGDPGDTEIRQLRLAVLGEQDIRRFHVAVQGAAPVRGFQRAGDLHPDVQGVAPADRPAVLDLGLQRTVRVVLHDNVRPTGGGGADLENTDDVRVTGELAHRHLLTHEPLEVVRFEVGGEHLDRHRAVESSLDTAIHHTEAAAADLLGVLETGRHQLRRYPGVLVPLRRQRVDVGHRSPRYSGGAVAAP